MVLDGSQLYIANMLTTTGSIVSLPASGGAPITLASGRDYPSAIAFNAKSIFWIEYGPTTGAMKGAILKIAKP
jgi:hypothetical protein